LQAGEYVSLGKVEAELKTCPIVENICVYGDPSKHYTVALVVPNQKHLEDLALKHCVTGDFDKLCESPVLEKAVVKELADHAKKCKFFLLKNLFSKFKREYQFLKPKLLLSQLDQFSIYPGILF
jgi:long-subunit acyl-CoA synthetase (AMP-forming)